MEHIIQHFQLYINTIFLNHFEHNGENIVQKMFDEDNYFFSILHQNISLTSEEEIIILLALMPHISPQTLDIFFTLNKDLDRPYTEFGGWKGTSHNGFIPTGETAAFLLSAGHPEKREEVIRILSKDHWFYKENILRCEGQGEGEPFLSGMLRVSDEVLAQVYGIPYEPEYNSDFPAKKIITPLEWEDLVLPYNIREELDDIIRWLKYQQQIKDQWQLERLIKPGYRCLFYGPPGTGKTLTAMLLGKQNNMDVYRIDLSMIVSKYIGETEKNLAKVFDKALHHNWILFFDEADALFGQRTDTQSSNDRHANQEVAYLLQRIEDFPGMVILATNLKENIDEAFFRRFQSALYFPVPDERLRYQLWENMLPAEWMPEPKEDFLHQAASYKLSGGSMVNIIQSCAIKLYGNGEKFLSFGQFRQAVEREMRKEGKIFQIETKN